MEKEKVLDQNKAHKDIFLDFLPYIIIILVVLILRTFIATPVRVNGSSMETTLLNGETMILNKIAIKLKDINRWNIVVIKTSDSFIIKRVIGLPGETIKYENNTLYINNKEVEDKYSLTETLDFEEITLNENEYFVMGDNRYISQDSRVVGPIKKDDIIGKTNIRLFPIDKLGYIEK